MELSRSPSSSSAASEHAHCTRRGFPSPRFTLRTPRRTAPPLSPGNKYFAKGDALELGGDANKAAREIYGIALDDGAGLRVSFGTDALEKLAN